MRISTFCLPVILLTAACATAPQANLDYRTLAFECDDVVVVGRVENGSFAPVNSENEILGHGWTLATLKVQKVVRGANVPSILAVKYFAHTYMREDLDFMLVVSKTDEGGYEITGGQSMRLHPVLAKHCTRDSPQ